MKSSTTCRLSKLLILLIPFILFYSNLFAEERSPTRWEKDIQAFEAQDKIKPPPKDPILFVGSSSIRMWKVEESFPDLPVMNRGFGGSEISDSVYYAPRIVIPYKPKIVVFYAGDNDLALGKTPEQVCEDFKQFVKIVHDALPNTRIVWLNIKPSIARWKIVDQGRKANQLIWEFVKNKGFDEGKFGPNYFLYSVDVDEDMIGSDSLPRKELFGPDGLHMNAEGYALWTEQLRPYLKSEAYTLDASGRKKLSEDILDPESMRAAVQARRANLCIYFEAWDRINVQKPSAPSGEKIKERLADGTTQEFEVARNFKKSELNEFISHLSVERRLAVVTLSKVFNVMEEKEREVVMNDLETLLKANGFKKVIFHGAGAFFTSIWRE